MRSHAKASPAGSSKAGGRKHRRLHGWVGLCVLGLVAFLGSSAPAADADNCPNVIFRTGPSAKLPECRAYELVSPAYTGGVQPQMNNVLNWEGAFPFSLITSGADSVTYQTVAGALSGFPGSGYIDRYEAKRTANGWKTEFIGVKGSDGAENWYGGSSPEHKYYFVGVGGSNTKLEPESPLLAPFGGYESQYLRTPSGFELIARGSLGEFPNARGRFITEGASHVIFSSSAHLEPQAAPTGTESVYDRTPGGPTHVVSLLPGNEPFTGRSSYQGASKDGSEIVFGVNPEGGGGYGGEGAGAASSSVAFYVRLNNATTEAIARRNEVEIGTKLSCTGGPKKGATLSYEWLRNGVAIGGANSATYTTIAADAGKVLQCQVAASNGEGLTLAVSGFTKLVKPVPTTLPPARPENALFNSNPKVTGNPAVGQLLTCSSGTWTGSPTFAYQWFRNGTEIAGASSSAYTLVAADKGQAVQCRVDATNAGGSAVAFSEKQVITANPPIASANPALSDVTNPNKRPIVGDQLSCTSGTWANSPSFSYQWLRNGAEIGGATASTYTVTVADEEKGLQCLVTATNADATNQAVSRRIVVDPQPNNVPPPRLTQPGAVFFVNRQEEFEQEKELECSRGAWESKSEEGEEVTPTFAYQWLKNGVEISGATNFSYTLTPADRQTMLECRVTATNVGGSTVAINSRYVNPHPLSADASLPSGGLSFAGVRNGNVFYANGSTGVNQTPADLYSFNTASQTTTRITNVGDALYVNVSEDGSHVYFISESEIGGEGIAGQPNLYVWAREGNSTTYIATVDPTDLSKNLFNGQIQGISLSQWTYAIGPEQEAGDMGLGNALSRTTPDGSVLVFESRAQLTSYDNTAEELGECEDPSETLETLKCGEIYRYDTRNDELTCISCPTGGEPPHGDASLQSYGGGILKVRPLTIVTPPLNVTSDGSMVFFETPESLLPQDGNNAGDVYRWKEGEGLALMSTGQALTNSYLYSMTPNASDVLIETGEQLLPEDENGATWAIFDARVNGGFPPPEKTVTEPCAGDACQGNPTSPPVEPTLGSASVSGTGNVTSKAPRSCPKGKRAVRRRGHTRCVAVKRHMKKHRRARTYRGTTR